jgi:hypothetical protein
MVLMREKPTPLCYPQITQIHADFWDFLQDYFFGSPSIKKRGSEKSKNNLINLRKSA